MTWAEIGDFIIRYWIQVALGGIVTAGGFLYRRLSKRLKKNREDDKALKDGMLSILYDRLVQLYNHYDEKGYCPPYALKSADEMYRAYHNLGGNGTITNLYEKLQQMPGRKKGE